MQNPQGVSRGVASCELDGEAQPGAAPALAGDGEAQPGAAPANGGDGEAQPGVARANAGDTEAARSDGAPAAPPGAMIPLVDDGTTHRVRVVLGPAAVPEAEAVAPVQPAGT